MKTLLKTEEIAIFLICVVLFNQLDFAWWWFPALLLLPDISMVGYVINTKTGALIYNIVHHRLTAALIAIYGFQSGNDWWKLAAIILFAHISFDRIMGYGLKFSDSFNNTHLGVIGKKGNS